MDYGALIAKKDAEFNEEQTKHALVLPILDRILGWDIYDDKRLIPEFTADSPGKNGEKVDYALDLQGDNNPEVLIEVKPLGSRLSSRAAAQLYRYFTMTEATIGILTDGFRWKIYSDLDKPNVMDEEPFLDFSLEDLDSKKQLEKLFQTLSFTGFDVAYLRTWGESSRDTEKLRKLVEEELSKPSEDFSRYFFSKLHPGARGTSNRIEALRDMLIQVLSERDKGQLEAISDLSLKQLPKTIAVAQQPGTRRSSPRKSGYFISDQGHRSLDGGLKQAWISYWSEIAKDSRFRHKLLESAIHNSPAKGIILLESTSYVSSIGYELFVYSNLSSENRILCLEKLSDFLGIRSELVYTDGLEGA